MLEFIRRTKLNAKYIRLSLSLVNERRKSAMLISIKCCSQLASPNW